MINLSVDAHDMEGHFDPTVNEIESVLELIYEVLLDHEDFLPEEDEPDPENRVCFMNLDHIITTCPFQLTIPVGYTLRNTFKNPIMAYSDPALNTLSPPPKETA